MFSFTKLAALLLVAVPGTLAGNLIVRNNLGFTIWCGAADNQGASSPVVAVPSGAGYTSPLPAMEGGAVLKCADNPGYRPVYQFEVATTNGRTWMDLSSLDGSPFLGYHRHAEVPGTSCVLDCPAGSTACEWPVMVDCASTADAIMTLG
ncbi:hypothetical protein F4778DRAFT_728633 [Xylariomycetidae sp. FL2044]|nr:hypothetical protein F4778DRAFT_728633 [Xylariomycetidae sp. FL2044]